RGLAPPPPPHLPPPPHRAAVTGLVRRRRRRAAAAPTLETAGPRRRVVPGEREDHEVALQDAVQRRELEGVVQRAPAVPGGEHQPLLLPTDHLLLQVTSSSCLLLLHAGDLNRLRG